MLFLLPFALGIVAGLRTMTPLAALAWAGYLGWLDFSGTPYAFVGHGATALVLTVLALGELVTDQLPNTPSRRVPVQFGTRILVGALAGGLLSGDWLVGLALGAMGAIVGTVGGAAARSRLASTLGKDRPAALIEDAVAILAAVAIVYLA